MLFGPLKIRSSRSTPSEAPKRPICLRNVSKNDPYAIRAQHFLWSVHVKWLMMRFAAKSVSGLHSMGERDADQSNSLSFVLYVLYLCWVFVCVLIHVLFFICGVCRAETREESGKFGRGRGACWWRRTLCTVKWECWRFSMLCKTMLISLESFGRGLLFGY